MTKEEPEDPVIRENLPHEEVLEAIVARLRNPETFEQAARDWHNIFFDNLLQRTARKLGPQIRQRIAPEEVVNSAYKDFFAAWNARSSFRNRDPDGLRRTLWRILSNKIVDRIATNGCILRDFNREERVGSASLETSRPKPPAQGFERIRPGKGEKPPEDRPRLPPNPPQTAREMMESLRGRESAELVAVLADLLEKLPPELTLPVVLRIQGYAQEEIAHHLQTHRKRVRELLQLAEEVLLAEENHPGTIERLQKALRSPRPS